MALPGLHETTHSPSRYSVLGGKEQSLVRSGSVSTELPFTCSLIPPCILVPTPARRCTRHSGYGAGCSTTGALERPYLLGCQESREAFLHKKNMP